VHLTKSVEEKGRRTGVLEMRRHLSNYFKNLTDFRSTRRELVTENDPEKVFALLDVILARWG
jgi:tRNA-dihydrouridine synthase